MTTAPEQHLWEIDHPYYGADGYANEADSFTDFVADTEWLDPDLNHLYRWDWHKPGFHDWDGRELLQLFFIMPRKSACMSYSMPVTEADEPAVREYLAKMAGHVATLWEPVRLPEAGTQ